MSKQFSHAELSVQLLRNGISPRRVHRIISELRDHFHDLKTAALESGMSESQASAHASSELGAQKSVLNELLSRPELRSWSALYPWLAYAVLPPAIMAGIVVLSVFVIQGTLFYFGKTAGISLSVNTALMVFKFVAPLLLAGTVCWIALSRYIDLMWPSVGIFIICVVGGSFGIGLKVADEIGGASIWVSMSFLPPFTNQIEAVVRILINLLAVLAPYIYLTMTRHIETELRQTIE